MHYIILFASLCILVYGANHIIIQSEKIALKLNISRFTIGATIIALGTSLPETVTSVMASYQNKTDFAMANILGSITFNISLVLGIIFLISNKTFPCTDSFSRNSAWSLVPVIVLGIMLIDGLLNRFDGIILLFLMVGYLYFLSKDENGLEGEVEEGLLDNFSWAKTYIFLILGFILVIVGSNYTISSASTIAQNLGVSEWIIALVLVAFGTSLPELAVSIVAAKKGQSNMLIGNIIGSNIANITVALGVSAFVSPIAFSFAKNGFDFFCVVGATVMLIFFTTNKIYDKSTGIALLSIIFLMLANSLNALI